MNKTLREIRRCIKEARDGIWFINKPEPFYKEFDNVKYKMVPASIKGYHYDDSWYLKLGYNYVIGYEKKDDINKLDFSFLDVTDLIKMNLKGDVDKVILKSSNIRYADFDIDEEYNYDKPISFEIMVDTDIIDAKESIKEFIKNNKSICEKDCSFVIKGMDSTISKLAIMKTVLSSETPDMNISFNNKKSKKYEKIR